MGNLASTFTFAVVQERSKRMPSAAHAWRRTAFWGAPQLGAARQ